jgi:Flp pilus assembly protein TadG
MVELAVVLPVLILLAIGVMDYGRVYFTSIAVANAARAGAEWGAQGTAFYTDDAKIQSFAQLDGAEAAPITITSNHVCKCGGTAVTCAGTTCSGGYGVPIVLVEVTASKTLALLIKYPGLPTTITITRTATFREQ